MQKGSVRMALLATAVLSIPVIKEATAADITYGIGANFYWNATNLTSMQATPQVIPWSSGQTILFTSGNWTGVLNLNPTTNGLYTNANAGTANFQPDSGTRTINFTGTGEISPAAYADMNFRQGVNFSGSVLKTGAGTLIYGGTSLGDSLNVSSGTWMFKDYNNGSSSTLNFSNTNIITANSNTPWINFARNATTTVGITTYNLGTLTLGAGQVNFRARSNEGFGTGDGAKMVFTSTTVTGNATVAPQAGDRSAQVALGSVSGAYKLTVQDNLYFGNVQNQVYIGSTSARSTYSGGTDITAGPLTAVADGALGTGDVNLSVGSSLILQGGVLNDYIGNSAGLTIPSGMANGAVNLAFSGTDYVGSVSLNGVVYTSGTFGAVGSGATHTSSVFTGTGLIAVPEPAALGLVAISGLGLLRRGRRA